MKEEKKFQDRTQKRLDMENNIKQEFQEGDEIDKLVSLSFDENPATRKECAKKLGNFLSDPRAILALIDLSADKDEEVKQTAKKILENYHSPDKEAFSSLEKFFEKLHENTFVPEEIEKQKSLMLPQVEKLFTSQIAKEKLLPSIEKLFSRKSKKLSDEELPKGKKKEDLPLSFFEQEQAKEQKEIATKQETDLNFPLPDSIKEKISSPIFSIPKIESLEKEEEFEEQEKLPSNFLDFYKYAFILASTPGIKASDINKEKKHLISVIKHNISLAFKLAIKKAKQEGGIESLAGLKVGMNKISTLPLEVLDLADVYIPKGKKNLLFLRILLSDGKNSLALYLPKEKGAGIGKGDLITLKNVHVDFIIKNPNATSSSEKGELCFLLSKNSQIIITR
ncbi:MAG: HEAT repeat domain-containing protein [Candidatus Omnitrophica bacterium]|nr:HEAT repeat domain-containing protein [Candidatus Omnitrophota bacterium]